MVVEDEARLRNSLAVHMPWEEYGFEVIGTASNGHEALRLMEQKMPDIAIVDIQMPDMDGLELARRIRESGMPLKVIVLSGHDSFEYAQRALEYGVVKYLLKPAGKQEIMEAVREAAEQLRDRLDEVHGREALMRKWNDHLPRLQELFWQNCLAGKYASWEMEQKGRDVQLDLFAEEGRHIAAVLDIDPLLEGETRFLQQDVSLLRFSVECIAKEFLQGASCRLFPDAEGATVVLFSASADEPPDAFTLRVHLQLVKVLTNVKECLKVTASAGISGCADSALLVQRLYREARSALSERAALGPGLAIPFREPSADSPADAEAPSAFKALETALETGEFERAASALDAWWDERMERAGSAEEVRERLLLAGSLFVRTAHQHGWPLKEVAGDDYAFFHGLQRLTEKSQIREWLGRIVRGFARYAESRRKTGGHQTVRTVLALIEAEIDKELNLYDVADRIFVNSSYLSRLFKQETGKTFSAYVLERKMECAKAALARGVKVYDAAAMTGYGHVSYFTKVFRKYWGVSPGEIKHNFGAQRV
ncbi:response regulator transcription factor [Paenibacillus flagellatus]|nr:response regulator [Paenibacillus flagellatus]